MKTKLTQLALLGSMAVLMVAAAARAQGLDDILKQLPAQDSTQGQPLIAQIIKLGPGAVTDLCKQVHPPAQADDARARFALHGVVTYASRAGANDERQMVETALLSAMSGAADVNVKTFFINQLQLAGKDASVSALGKLLAEEDFCEPAAQALLEIRTPAAVEQFRAALAGAKGKRLVTIVHALGALADKASAAAIVQYAGTDDFALRHATLYALANMGDECAIQPLTQAAEAKGVYARSDGTRNLLLLARRLAEAGNKDAAVKIARDLMKSRTEDRSINVQSACLQLLADVLGDGALAELTAALDSKNMQLREAVVKTLAKMPGQNITAVLAGKAAGSTGATKAAIIAALGKRGDGSAGATVLGAIGDADAAVREAAIAATAQLSPAGGTNALVGLTAGTDATEVGNVKAALLSIKDTGAGAIIAAALPKASPIGRAALLEVLGARLATDQSAVALNAAANDADANVRVAAIAALASMAGAQDAPRIVQILLSAKTPAETREAGNTLAALCRVSPAAVSAVLDELPKSKGESHRALLAALSRIGGALAVKGIMVDVDGADEALRDAAIRALADWPDASAAAELLKIASTAKKDVHRTLSLRGYLRLAALPSDRPAAATLAMYKDALAIAKDAPQKKLILSGLGNVHTIEALQLAGGYLDDPALVEEAGAAAVKIAGPQGRRDAGLTGDAVVQILEKVIASCKNDNTIRQATAHLQGKRVKPAKKGKASAVSAPESSVPTANGPAAEAPAAAPASAPAVADPYANDPMNTPPEGFVALFNGKDLTGWKGLHGNPESRAKMTPEQLAKAQAKADDTMRQHWKVENGVLVFDGKGLALCTAKDYGDFEMWVDWKIGPHGDSGIYLRGSPQVQIWQNREGSGGLYNNKINAHSPLVYADNPIGSWNRFHIKMVGDRVWVWLNGKAVVDNVVMENYWNRAKPIYPTGQIELQNHSTTLWFRNLYLKEIPRP